MVPVELDGRRVFLFGVRESPGEPFRYLRIPADEGGRRACWLACACAKPCWTGAAREGGALRRARDADRQARDDAAAAATALRAPTLSPAQAEPMSGRREASPATAGPASGQGHHGGLQAISTSPRPASPRRNAVHLRSPAAHPEWQPVRAAQPVAAQAGPGAARTRCQGAGLPAAAVLSLSDSFFLPGAGAADPERLPSRCRRVCSSSRAPRPGAGLPTACSDRRRVRDALHPRAAPVVWPRRGDRRTRLTMALSSTRHAGRRRRVRTDQARCWRRTSHDDEHRRPRPPRR